MKIGKIYVVAIVLGALLMAGSFLRATFVAGCPSGQPQGQEKKASGTTSGGGGQQNSGAIFTTNESGTSTNQNIYAIKNQVFLNGGPQNANCGAAGLADGDYYFQVTDPSGNVLLSTDDVSERRVRITSGVISHYLGGTHQTGSGPCQSISVALAPFNDTPNYGGEHKAWMTPVVQYDASLGSFGFKNSESKTDNFKVLASKKKRTGTIMGRKFRDLDANGVDSGEPGISGITVTLNGMTRTTDLSGQFVFDGIAAGTYDLCEVLPVHTPAWLRTTPTTDTGCYSLVLDPGEVISYQNFGNILLTEVQGKKILDANANGKDDGESQLAGFTVELTGTGVNGRSVNRTAITDENGQYRIADLLPGSYSVCESLPSATPPWQQTFPNGCHEVAPAEGEVLTGKDFGNIQLSEIHGMKFDDHNADGVRTAGDDGLPGFTIVLNGTAANGATVSQSRQTDAWGTYEFTGLLPGSYSVCEVQPGQSVPPWLQTAPVSDAGCYALALQSGQVAEDLDFGNIQLAEVHGKKFYDANANGLDDDQQVIAAWRIALQGTAVNDQDVTLSSMTSQDGQYAFTGLLPGTYTVGETMPPSGSYGAWIATTPVSVTETRNEGQTQPAISFGNVCVGSGGGKAIGFWTNQNGEALVGAEDLTTLRGLSLRNSSGSAFDPATYASLETWLLNAKSTNMAYMLSAHLAVMKLNVLNGLVDDTLLVQAPGAQSANALAFASVRDLMNEAEEELALHGSTPSGNAARAYQEALKNALDNANNDRSFVKRTAAACPVQY